MMEPAPSLQGRRNAPGATRRGFAVQARVIHALVLREMQTRFGRDSIGFVWLFLEPLLLSFGIAAFKVLASNRFSGEVVPPFLFAVTGYAPYFAFRSLVSQSTGAFRSNMTLLYHHQVKLFDVMVARTLLESTAIMMVLAVVAGGAIMVAGMMPHSIPTLISGMIMIFLFAHGLSLLVATGAALSETFARLVPPMMYLSLPFSGALFDLHSLPPSIREALLWNPQVHFHEMVRDGMFGDLLPAYYDLGYMAAFIIGSNLLGMAAMRAARSKFEY